ncbi:hypothetical protein [Hansschlegelia plantiphila]|uniref:Uncharacterized protein n=1 Tax=Hansschlegelia plantiphila TaxID=374655 RepID=A0A9W6J2I7_9HYPH|nr:hypothetical protein [Hansschlegelia plantiphila]GLK68114.1 hypothetical protein GCM10008179_17520 [Hansschlegelia plantiphila]
MPPATAADLVGAIQPLTQLTDRWLKSATLNLFENKVIEPGPAGRAALKRNPREAAALAVGLLAAPSTAQAGRYALGILGAGRQRGSRIDPHECRHSHELGKLIEVALSRPYFIDALSVMIQEWKILESGLAYYAGLPTSRGLTGEWKAELTVQVWGTPNFGAHIELDVREVFPLSESGFDQHHTFLGIEADWLGDATEDLESGDPSDVVKRLAHQATHGFDQRVIIALGRRLGERGVDY